MALILNQTKKQLTKTAVDAVIAFSRDYARINKKLFAIEKKISASNNKCSVLSAKIERWRTTNKTNRAYYRKGVERLNNLTAEKHALEINYQNVSVDMLQYVIMIAETVAVVINSYFKEPNRVELTRACCDKFDAFLMVVRQDIRNGLLARERVSKIRRTIPTLFLPKERREPYVMPWDKCTVGEDCPICTEDLGERFYLPLACGHSFHHDCIRTWVTSNTSNRSCPMCRKPINERL